MNDDASRIEDERRRIASEALPLVMDFAKCIAGEATLAARRMDGPALLLYAMMGILFAPFVLLTWRMSVGLLPALKPRAARTASSEAHAPAAPRTRRAGTRRDSSGHLPAPAEAVGPCASHRHAPARSWHTLAAIIPATDRASPRNALRSRDTVAPDPEKFLETLSGPVFARPDRYDKLTSHTTPTRATPPRATAAAPPQ